MNDELLQSVEPSLKWPPNPYPGLRPFRVTETDDEALVFYGRNAQKDDILARLNTSHLVFVVGPSGCGKSSLIKVGVIPALEAGLLTRVGHNWHTIQMRPAQRPLTSLASAFAAPVAARLGERGNITEDLERLLASDRSALWLIMDRLWPQDAKEDPPTRPIRVLLLIDQFEEVFGPQISDVRQVDQFIQLIIRFFKKPHRSLYIVLTMRTDYIGCCANFAGLAEAINETQYLIPVLRTSELKQAITRPAEDYHGKVEPELVNKIIHDVGVGTAYIPDHLPLMQHALLWLWRKAWLRTGATEPPRPDRDPPPAPVQLELEDYDGHGQLQGILDFHANEILSRVTSGSGGACQERIAEVMFRRLCERDVGARYRRSPASVGELCRLAGCEPGELHQVIAPFADPEASFIELREAESFNDALVDISHESLIRQWRQLKTWADKEANEVREFRQFVSAAQAWADRQKGSEFLRTRGQLEVLQQWWSTTKPSKEWARRYSLVEGGSETLADVFDLVEDFRAKSAELDQEERAAAEAAKAAAEATRIDAANAKAREQRNKIIMLAGVALTIAIAVAWALNDQRKDAEEQLARLAHTNALTLALRGDEALWRDGPAKALLITLEGLTHNALPDIPEFEQVAYRALQQLREEQVFSNHPLQVTSADFSKDGTLLTASTDPKLRLWNPQTGALIKEIPLPDSPSFFGAKWSPDGERILVGTMSGQALVVDARSSKIIQAIGNQPGAAGPGVFSPDGRWILTGGFNASAKLWDANTGELKRDLGPGRATAFSSDHRVFATGGGDGVIRVFDIETVLKAETPESKTHPSRTPTPKVKLTPETEGNKTAGSIFSLAFHPQRPNVLLSTWSDGKARLWDVVEERLLAVFGEHGGHKGSVFQGTFSPDGNYIATASEDRTVRLWRVDNPKVEPAVLRGHTGGVWAVDFSPDGQRIVSGSTDKTARIWRLQPVLHPDVGKVNRARPLGNQARIKDDIRVQCASGQSSTLTMPPGFKYPAIATCAPWKPHAVVAPSHGHPILFDVNYPEKPIAVLGESEERWQSIEFSLEPEDRITGITVSGEQYTWPAFRDRHTLAEFARKHLPRENNQPVRLTPEERCGLEADLAIIEAVEIENCFKKTDQDSGKDGP